MVNLKMTDFNKADCNKADCNKADCNKTHLGKTGLNMNKLPRKQLLAFSVILPLFTCVEFVMAEESNDASAQDVATKAVITEVPQAGTDSEAQSTENTVSADEKVSTEQLALHASSTSNALNSSAISFTCYKSGEKRVIRVNPNPSEGVICEITYQKASEIQTLWQAKHDAAFCENKSKAFVQQQIGWGFHCVDGQGDAVDKAVTSEGSEESVEG